MALRLIIGAANSGKTGHIVRGLCAAVPWGTPSLVVPTKPDVRDWAEELWAHGLIGVDVTTFGEWIERLWRLHGDGRALVGEAGRAALVRSAIREAGHLPELGKSVKSDGFPLLVADIVRRMPLPPPASSRSGEAAALARILDGYRSAVESAGFVEPVEVMRRLASAPPPLSGSVFVSRFTDMDHAQESLIRALSESSDLTVALSWSPGAAASAGIDPLVRRLMAVATDIVETGADTWSDPGVARFCARVFEGLEPLPEPTTVRFGEAAGPEAECSLVARVASEVLTSSTDGSTTVAVVFRDVVRRLDDLVAALDAAGVPHSVDVRLPFSRTPFGAALIAGLDACAGRGEGRGRLLAFLTSPFSGAEASWVAEAEREWRKGATTPDRALAAALGDAPPDTAEVLRLLQCAVSAGVGPETQSKWQKLAGLMLHNAVVRTNRDVSAIDASAHRALLDAVCEIGRVCDDATESDLGTALRSVEVSSGTGEHEGVLVTEAHRLKGRRFDIVIVGGLTADEFSPEGRESLATALLRGFGARDSVDEGLQERAVFHAVVTRARQRLVLIRQAADERGDPVRASAFWDAALDVYRDAPAAQSGEPPAGVVMLRENLADLERVAPALLRGRQEERLAAPVSAPRTPTRGILADDDVRRMLRERSEYSVSEIETYLSCPYKWFVERAVRPRTIDATFDVRERGSLAHEILAGFYVRWREAGEVRVSPERLPPALELLGRVADERIAVHPVLAAGGLAEALDATTARRWTHHAVTDDAHMLPGFAPSVHELAFGLGADRPVEVGGVHLRGFIDRVDEGPEGVVVTDYKTGRSIRGRGTFESGGVLQAPIYAAVVRQLTGRPVVGAVYRSLSGRSVRGTWIAGLVDFAGHGSKADGVTQDEFETDLEEAVQRMTQAVDRMRSGHIACEPRSGACRNCSALVWCEGVRP